LVRKINGDSSVAKSNTIPFPDSYVRQVTELKYEFVLRFSTFDFRGFLSPRSGRMNPRNGL
jgi:hypothetical protein